MIRTQICITEIEKKELEVNAKFLGISVAEFIRRILDEYLGIGTGIAEWKKEK